MVGQANPHRGGGRRDGRAGDGERQASPTPIWRLANAAACPPLPAFGYLPHQQGRKIGGRGVVDVSGAGSNRADVGGRRHPRAHTSMPRRADRAESRQGFAVLIGQSLPQPGAYPTKIPQACILETQSCVSACRQPESGIILADSHPQPVMLWVSIQTIIAVCEER